MSRPPALTYHCSGCGAAGVKLWRQYQIFLSYLSLFCLKCAERDQGQRLGVGSDQIGWLVPAVPDLLPDAEGVIPDEGTFWGYTSVPEEGVRWWVSLPPELPVHAKEPRL